MPGFEKLDTGLRMALRAHADSGHRDSADGISISLRFTGDLAAIEALGFETHMVLRGEALGIVRFKDIDALVAHPGVTWMAAGQGRTKDLDTAVPDIRARASAPISGAPVDGLWHTVAASGAFTNVPDGSGKGVIVAIIDTGIDYKHPMFMSQLTPTKKTRILRIWDQGLAPAALADCPPVARLASADTYGVEYDNTEIETALNGGAAILHKDCIGHGTHVAGIAAGGVVFPTPGGDASKVGVAPEADIIAVKFLDTPDTIKYRLAGGFGADVGPLLKFRDAVMYCLNTARDLGKAVVINMSFGNSGEAGDGLDDDAIFVDGLLDPAQAPGPMHFPVGAIIVKSSGNDGSLLRRQMARIVVPAAGEITVPLELKDTRGGLQTTWEQCTQRLHKPAMRVAFWYRRANPFTSVLFALRLPNQVGFGGGDMGVGGHLERGFVPRVGPPPSVAFVTPANNVHSAFVVHEGNPSVPHPAGGSVRRHLVSFQVQPKDSGGTVSYHPGIYEMRIKAPPGTEIFALCRPQSWAAGKRVTFEIGTQMQDGTAPHANIQVTSEFSAADTLGQHVITVASYDDSNHHLAVSSSRGPLRDFSDPANPLPPIATKPDIAAPGVKINSAQGVDTEALLPRLPPWGDGVRFQELSGTSMAAPMVAGVIALMLDKKANLNITEVRAKLSAAARPGANPAAPPSAHTNAYGSGMIDALPSHLNTP